jgi:Transposase DDE domain
MSHQDSKYPINADCLQKAIMLLIGSLDFTSLHFRNDCTWLPLQIVAAALIWAWSDEQNLHARFHHARKIIDFIFPPQREFGNSYQGFIKLLVSWTAPLMELLQKHFRAIMQKSLASRFIIYDFAVFAVDGSRADLPRTKSHEQAYGRHSKKNKKQRNNKRGNKHKSGYVKQGGGPQLWLTTLWHMGTGLPWNWRIGPADSSERGHWLEMLCSLPLNALIVADAGFVGYNYTKAVIDSGRDLLLRVGSNVQLIKHLGRVHERNGVVYLWPDKAAKQKLPPLVLRLVVVHNGKHPVYLITSVLNEKILSNEQIADLYSRRWGIELFYRNLKQTFGRRKLRSGCAKNARVELEWSLAGLWAMGLYAQIEMQKAGISPQRISVARVLFAFRQMLRYYRDPLESKCSLREMLRCAVIDDYRRKCKTSRNYPRQKQETPPGPPKITVATPVQISLAQSLELCENQKRLPA